jgi:RNA polymerase sigma factor (TIGR02999 family)
MRQIPLKPLRNFARIGNAAPDGHSKHGAVVPYLMSKITQILNSVDSGVVTDELLPLVYEELRRLAAQRLARESEAQTLQPTALVHEAYLRLIGSGDPNWKNRAHFFGAAAEAMRRVLIDAARTRQRQKRDAGNERFVLAEEDRQVLPLGAEILDLNEALGRLEHVHPDKAQVVKLRFFAGMTTSEIATALGLSKATVERYWTFARAWLHRELQK